MYISLNYIREKLETEEKRILFPLVPEEIQTIGFRGFVTIKISAITARISTKIIGELI